MKSCLRRVLAVCVLLVPLLAAPTLTESAGAGPRYSSPVWWPLSTPSEMDCYKRNPGGCGNTHPKYQWDIKAVPGVNNQPIYAMGAGTVHVGARNYGCGHAQSRGNYVYVNHGHGVLSYYGHLGHIFVHSGQHVTPRTRLAYVGNSGYARCHLFPKLRYTMIVVKHGGTGGHTVETTHTYACVPHRSKAVMWPQQLAHAHKTHWNAVARRTPIPATTRSCVPR